MPISPFLAHATKVLVEAVVAIFLWMDWRTLLTFVAGTMAAIAGAQVQGHNLRKAADREAVRKEADRIRETAGRARLSALRLALTLEGYGHQAARWHAEIEDDIAQHGGGVTSLPPFEWPPEISWEAVGIATANEALAFEIDVRDRDERLDGAFNYDGDVGQQLIPGELLQVADSAAKLAAHIRGSHKIEQAAVIAFSGWNWRKYVKDQLRAQAEAKASVLAAAEARRRKKASNTANAGASKD